MKHGRDLQPFESESKLFFFFSSSPPSPEEEAEERGGELTCNYSPLPSRREMELKKVVMRAKGGNSFLWWR